MSAGSVTQRQSPASPRKRAILSTLMLMVLGVMPGMGIPGVLMLGLADRLFIAFTGATALRAIGDAVWPLSMIVTVLLPLPLLPALSWVSRWRTAGVGMRLFSVLCALLVWGLSLSVIGLYIALQR